MDTAFTASTPSSNAEMEAAVFHMFQQIDALREQMKVDDAAIAKIRAESALLSAQSRVTREETRSILANLRSIIGA